MAWPAVGSLALDNAGEMGGGPSSSDMGQRRFTTGGVSINAKADNSLIIVAGLAVAGLTVVYMLSRG